MIQYFTDKKNTKNVFEKAGILLEKLDNLNYIERNLGCVDGKIIGIGRSDNTKEATPYLLSRNEDTIELIDIPGIEGNEKAYESEIKKALEKAHLIFYVRPDGKKIEKETLLKIKKYIKDGTSLYEISNVHKTPQLVRKGPDKAYNEELYDAYLKEKNLITQTGKQLYSILGKNFKDSIILNGQLAFCAYAIDGDRTSIAESKTNELRINQKKYLNEYGNSVADMISDSHFSEIERVIEDKADRITENIYYENIKKLKNRLFQKVKDIEEYRKAKEKEIKDYQRICDNFEQRCEEAKEDFIFDVDHSVYDIVSAEFIKIEEKIFDRIETDEGKTKKEEIEKIIKDNEPILIDNIETGINEKMKHAAGAFEQAVMEAQKRMQRDFERVMVNISVSVDIGDIAKSYRNVNQYSVESLGKDITRIASSAVSFAGLASIIPVIGTAAGAAIGVLVGVLMNVWYFFSTKQHRINRSKEKIHEDIDKAINETTKSINRELLKTDYKNKINNVYNQLCEVTGKQKKSLKEVSRLLQKIDMDLKQVLTAVEKEERKYV